MNLKWELKVAKETKAWFLQSFFCWISNENWKALSLTPYTKQKKVESQMRIESITSAILSHKGIPLNLKWELKEKRNAKESHEDSKCWISNENWKIYLYPIEYKDKIDSWISNENWKLYWKGVGCCRKHRVVESQMRIERFRQLLAFQFFLSAMNLKGELKVRSNV